MLYFVFLLGYSFQDKTSQWVDKNFNEVALRLDSKAVVVRGLKKEFDTQVLKQYKQDLETVVLMQKWEEGAHLIKELNNFLDGYRSNLDWSWNKLLPVFFITDRNPHESTSSLFYAVPLGTFNEEVDIREVVELILQCCESGDFQNLDQFLTQKLGREDFSLLESVNQSLELKPNVAGIGVNFNGLIDLFMRKFSKKNV